jgi:TolA-binding protein
MGSHRLCALAALKVLVLAWAGALAQQPGDSEADTLLRTARKAHGDGNFTFATEKFREFLTKFSGHREVNAARYGLGLSLLDLPERDYQKALEALSAAAQDAKFTDRRFALYYAGVSRRGMGLKELAAGVAKSNELPQRQQNANAQFAEAAKLFAQARDEFDKLSPPDGEWSARARCDAAEMELRLGRTKDARVTAEPFAQDPKFAKSQFRPLGLYYHGFACFLLGDITPAARSLNQLAPFDQPFGLHARYLMGRIHSAQDEKAEATAAFTAVLTSYEEQKKSAAEVLKQPDRFKNDPWEKSRLEELVKGPVPDYVTAAAFHRACLHYEAGKFAEALPTFQSFAREFASSPLKDDAILRAGFCLVQTRNFDEAAKTLQSLVGHPRLGYQAINWLGKSHLGRALASDPNDPNARTQQLTTAINHFKDAAFKSGQLAAQGDGDAKTLRPLILLEQADAHLTAKQALQAAQLYDQIANEKLLPAKADEVLQRAATAYHLAGDPTTSEARIATFLQQFPDSPLRPLVLFRSAENASLKAEQEVKKGNPAAAREAFGAATTKYEELIRKYPEFERVHRARYAQALCLTAREEWEKAAAVLEVIPAPERNGELAGVSYVLADCLIRTAPARAEDALADNILRERLTTAANLLEGFIAANPKGEQTADALLKLGLCYRRLGTQLAPGNDRNEALNRARGALERVPREFPQYPLIGSAHLERARVIALQGDKGGAVNTLRQFANDPLQKSPVAPLALIALATLLREQNQSQAAADTLKQARERFEAELIKDAARADWVPLLRYNHGVALFEAGKLAEARTAFEHAVQSGGNKPIGAESALRLLQCSAEETKRKLGDIEKERQKGNLTPQQTADLEVRLKAARGDLATIARQFDQRAEHFKVALPQSDACSRMLYEAAWAFRASGADAVAAYAKLIEQFPDLALSVEARLELAEIFVDAGKHEEAIKLLREAIDKEPTDKPTPQETLERIRLLLGGVLFDKKDFAGAQGQFEAVAANEKSPHRGQGLYRSAECLLAQGKTDEAVKKLVVFRDNPAFHNIAGVSDRAVLRLGHGLLLLKQWDAARQAFEAVVNRHGNGNPWAVDARYGIGAALLSQGKFDEAANAFTQVVQMTQDDRSGRARLQIGECRAKQSKWADAGKEFQAVYYGYDIPELKYTAMIEHARVLVEEKKPEDALKLLKKVIEEAPKDSEWAKAAQERLMKLKK